VRLTIEQIEDITRRPGYAVAAVAPKLPHPLPKPNAGKDPLGKEQDEEAGPGRVTVRIERRGAKLLDVDNLYGSVKYVCDALRYEGIIPADDPSAIDLIVTQKKVGRDQRGTLIEITPLTH